MSSLDNQSKKRTIVLLRVLADTNTFLAVALNEPERSWLIEVTRDAELASPAVLPYEVGNALSALARRGRLGAEAAREVWEAIQEVSVELVEVDVGESLRLAAEQGIYAYDAYFLECAMRLNVPLLTLDLQMRRIGRALGLRLLEQS